MATGPDLVLFDFSLSSCLLPLILMVLTAGATAPACGAQDASGAAANASAPTAQSSTDVDKKIAGFGVIDRVILPGPEPVFQADGYRIRIDSSTVVAFSGELKSLAEVGTNTWVKYEGKRDAGGVLVASQAAFAAARKVKIPASQLSTDQEAAPSQESRIDAKGNFVSMHTKVRMSDAGGWCGWHKVPADRALQERVHRVGLSVVPAYQKQLATDDSAKIHYRFYAVDEKQIRSDMFCVAGLILVPVQVVKRLKNDDQLAAVLADGVAFNIQIQSARLLTERRELMGVEIAGEIAGAFIPGVNLATKAGAAVFVHEMDLHMEEQRGRMALAILSDAGYDPWQAPEAWRLLAPKKMPGNANSLKYPARSEYQFGFLNSQYGARAGAGR